tara:strand:+ start:212340 stop:212906 length:567 start_codon:yes stop_codon:yes gene_type:complete
MAYQPGSLRLQLATRAITAGDVVACPTEAVWGLSCDPADALAVETLLTLKKRPVSKGLILVAASIDQLDFLLAGLPADKMQQLSDTWPGPATWLVPHHGRIPPWVSGVHSTVAVRVSAHPVVQALCDAWGGPLVSTSANKAGAQPARNAFQVRRAFGDELGALLPGAVGVSQRPTVIRDLDSGQIIRA